MSGMVSANHPSILRATKVVAKFGFLSRHVFDIHLARGSRTLNWMLWQKLLSTGYFRFYRDAFLKDEMITFSRLGISRLLDSTKIVKPIAVQNLSHDECVMGFALHNENENLIRDFSSEAMLKRDGNQRFSVGQKGDRVKYPDLLFSLNVPGKNIKVALEVERTRKSFKSYRSFLISYAGVPNIDFVIVACQSKGIETAIRETMKLLNYPVKERPIAFCSLEEMNQGPSDFQLNLNGHTTSLRQIVKSLNQQMAGAA